MSRPSLNCQYLFCQKYLFIWGQLGPNLLKRNSSLFWNKRAFSLKVWKSTVETIVNSSLILFGDEGIEEKVKRERKSYNSIHFFLHRENTFWGEVLRVICFQNPKPMLLLFSFLALLWYFQGTDLFFLHHNICHPIRSSRCFHVCLKLSHHFLVDFLSSQKVMVFNVP